MKSEIVKHLEKLAHVTEGILTTLDREGAQDRAETLKRNRRLLNEAPDDVALHRQMVLNLCSAINFIALRDA